MDLQTPKQKPKYTQFLFYTQSEFKHYYSFVGQNSLNPMGRRHLQIYLIKEEEKSLT